MEDKEIRQKLEQAVELVKNLDKDLKVEAFKILLPRLLNDVSSEIKTISEVDNAKLNNQKIENISSADKEKVLADTCGISIEELKDIISIKGETIEILIPLGRNTTNNLQCLRIIPKFPEWISSVSI